MLIQLFSVAFIWHLYVLVFSLIFRAVSIELRHRDERRKKFWQLVFIIGSFLPSLLFGVARGNIIVGIPLKEKMDFTGNFWTLLILYPLIISMLDLFIIALHGSFYLF
ncbi:MAG: cytochrome d ubiquinol oxidase subunit II [Candidatus Aminicenantia bacterium]